MPTVTFTVFDADHPSLVLTNLRTAVLGRAEKRTDANGEVSYEIRPHECSTFYFPFLAEGGKFSHKGLLYVVPARLSFCVGDEDKSFDVEVTSVGEVPEREQTICFQVIGSAKHCGPISQMERYFDMYAVNYDFVRTEEGPPLTYIYQRRDEEEPPKPCIIATVFLGEAHPFLPPMRKFRDKIIPKRIMDLYYNVSVFVLRKIGKCPRS